MILSLRCPHRSTVFNFVACVKYRRQNSLRLDTTLSWNLSVCVKRVWQTNYHDVNLFLFLTRHIIRSLLVWPYLFIYLFFFPPPPPPVISPLMWLRQFYPRRRSRSPTGTVSAVSEPRFALHRQTWWWRESEMEKEWERERELAETKTTSFFPFTLLLSVSRR